MKFKVLFQVFLIVFALTLSPAIVSAGAVPWSSTDYDAYVEYSVTDSQNSSTPPVNASDQGIVFSSATSSSLDGSIYPYYVPQISAGVLDYNALARTQFTGTYTVPSNLNLFEFTYSTVSRGSILGSNCSWRCAWLQVTDLTDSITLYSEYLSFSGSDSVISIPTITGHDISVNYGVQVNDYISTYVPMYYNNAELSYSTAVAPEPISSTLFVIGGSFMAGRRFLKKRK